MNKGSGYMSKIKKYISNPWEIVSFFVNRGMLNWMDDKSYLKLNYRAKIGKRLNLDNPKTFNEKLQWLKLNDKNPEYTKMVDKYAVKEYVAGIIGEEYIIPTIGVYDHFDDIDFDQLPNQFVIKCTHDSGGLVICKDKSELDISSAKKKIEKCLKNNYFYRGREWPYKNVKPRIIIEKYMVDESNVELKDYKFFCFNGEVKSMFIASNRGVDTRFDFYDPDFNHLPIINGHPMADIELTKPLGFEKMKELSTKLSKDIPHIRVDFFDCNGKVYFGELTLYHWSGMKKFEPEEWDYTFGEWINLPNKKKV